MISCLISPLTFAVINMLTKACIFVIGTKTIETKDLRLYHQHTFFFIQGSKSNWTTLTFISYLIVNRNKKKKTIGRTLSRLTGRSSVGRMTLMLPHKLQTQSYIFLEPLFQRLLRCGKSHVPCTWSLPTLVTETCATIPTHPVSPRTPSSTCYIT